MSVCIDTYLATEVDHVSVSIVERENDTVTGIDLLYHYIVQFLKWQNKTLTDSLMLQKLFFKSRNDLVYLCGRGGGERTILSMVCVTPLYWVTSLHQLVKYSQA